MTDDEPIEAGLRLLSTSPFVTELEVVEVYESGETTYCRIESDRLGSPFQFSMPQRDVRSRLCRGRYRRLG